MVHGVLVTCLAKLSSCRNLTLCLAKCWVGKNIQVSGVAYLWDMILELCYNFLRMDAETSARVAEIIASVAKLGISVSISS